MRAPIIGVLVLAASVANAAPSYLSCTGDWEDGAVFDRRTFGHDAFSLVVDVDAGTVSLGSWTLKIDSGDAAQIVASIGEGRDWRHVRLNRVTGEVHVVVPVLEHPGIFGGTCKPAQKLF